MSIHYALISIMDSYCKVCSTTYNLGNHPKKTLAVFSDFGHPLPLGGAAFHYHTSVSFGNFDPLSPPFYELPPF